MHVFLASSEAIDHDWMRSVFSIRIRTNGSASVSSVIAYVSPVSLDAIPPFGKNLALRCPCHAVITRPTSYVEYHCWSVLLYCYTLQRKKAERLAQQNRLQDFSTVARKFQELCKAGVVISYLSG